MGDNKGRETGDLKMKYKFAYYYDKDGEEFYEEFDAENDKEAVARFIENIGNYYSPSLYSILVMYISEHVFTHAPRKSISKLFTFLGKLLKNKI